MSIIPTAQLAIEKFLKIFPFTILPEHESEAQTQSVLERIAVDTYIFIQQPTSISNGRSLFAANKPAGTPYRFKATTVTRISRTTDGVVFGVISFMLVAKDAGGINGRLEVVERVLLDSDGCDFINAVFYPESVPEEQLAVAAQIAGYDQELFL